MLRNTITALVAGLLLVLAAAPGFAQEDDYPPVAATCGVDNTTPAPGETITLSCEGWLPNSEVAITFFSGHGVDLGTAPVDENGEVLTEVTIPADARPGNHTLVVSGFNADGEEQHVEIALRVLPEAVPDKARDKAAVAVTGMDSGLGAAMGLGLIVAGAGALYAARRRQAGQAA